MTGDQVLVNGNADWMIRLPAHRAARPEWPWWEAHHLAVMQTMIRRLWAANGTRPVVWDVGSEEGDFPALYTMMGAQVVLIEPNPKVWPNIKWVFEANGLEGRVAGWFVGLASDVDAIVAANPRVADGPHRHAAWNMERYPWPESAEGEVITDHGFIVLADGRDTVPQVRLDTMAAEWGFPHPDILTMDVEGGEGDVLAGAADLINGRHGQAPVIVASLHPQFVEGVDDLVRRTLGRAGYDERHICTDHEQHWLFIPPGMDKPWEVTA